MLQLDWGTAIVLFLLFIMFCCIIFAWFETKTKSRTYF
jgi:cbb3-type cytochrome oxidase subunit 3